MLPAASYRRPAFEPINLADADFGVGPVTSSAESDLLENGFVEANESEEIAPLLDFDFTSNENTVDSILDTVDEYQYKSFNSNVPSDPFGGQETLKDFRPDLLESYDSAKESDKNHSLNNVQRLPDVASCPALITSPDSCKDDCTISSELQSLNTSEICDIDSTNGDCSDSELYKCLQEYEERDDLLSVNCNGSSSADVITPQSEFSDELIAEKPLICDESVSETKDTLSFEASNDLAATKDSSFEVSNDLSETKGHGKPQVDVNKNEPAVLSEDKKIILEEILEDSSNIDVNLEENENDEQLLEKGFENILEVTAGCEIEKYNPPNDFCEQKNIPDLPVVPDSSLECEHEPIQIINQQIEELQVTDTNYKIVKENDESEVECVDLAEKEPTDSLCSLESTETILLKDDNQVSVNTVSDSLDSQSTCSLPSEVIGDTMENLEEIRLHRPNTLDLNGTTGCETDLQSTLSTGMFDRFVVRSCLNAFLV